MAQQAQSSQGGADNSLGPLWLTILLFAALFLVWYFAHDYIVRFVFQVKLVQAEFIRLFTSSISGDIAALKAANPSAVSFQEMVELSAAVGEYTRYIVIVVLVALGALLYFNNVILEFRRTYNMKDLRELEQNNWPQIKPVLKLDLLKEDIDKGPWAMAINPMPYAKRHKLLQEEPPLIEENKLKSKGKPQVSLIKSKARKMFTLQLGHYWNGIDNLPQHTLALFAIFAARMNRDRDSANKLLKQIANSTESGKLDFSGAYELAKKHLDSKLVQKVLNKHAFILTVMLSMLDQARHDGVIATADFLWLKPVDRPLWYCLNSLGRQTPFVEAAGPFAHWLAEKEVSRRIMVPMIEEAVNGLDAAIKELIYSPDEDQ
ncbi:MAG: type IVB secretion system coupling complex protein DotM/IcmP [Gammaproteobacteria bacterium]